MPGSAAPDPKPGEFWLTSVLRTVEILARDEVEGDPEEWGQLPVDTIAYRFVGGTVVHLRSVGSLKSWKKAEYQ